jgi:hypothetical protein
MFSKEEFFSLAPKENLPSDPNDEHMCMVRRLEFELKKRTEYVFLFCVSNSARLQEKSRELQARLKLLRHDNQKREKFLDTLRDKVTETHNAAKPIQQFISARGKTNDMVPLLPKPLYKLYNYVSIYKEAIGDDTISIEISGSRKTAKQYIKNKSLPPTDDTPKTDEDAFPLSLQFYIDCDKGMQPQNFLMLCRPPAHFVCSSVLLSYL